MSGRSAAYSGYEPMLAPMSQNMLFSRKPSIHAIVARCFAERDVETLSRQLEAAEIAFARVNDVAGILRHPHLRRVRIASPNGPIDLPAPPARFIGADEEGFGPLPALGEHTEAVRREFLGSDLSLLR